MPRLPQPGSDQGTWGQILNDYLESAHNSDGTLKPDTVGSSQLRADSVTSTQLADNAVTATQLAPGAVSSAEIQNGTITEAKLAAAVQTKLNAIGSGSGAVDSVAGKTGAVTLVKGDVGLANVDNVAAASLRDRSTHTGTQPINTVTNLQTSLDAKASTTALAAKADVADLADVATSGNYADLTGRPLIPTVSGVNTGDQTLAINGNTLSISGANGNSVSVPVGGSGGATNLSTSLTATAVTILSDTGTSADIPSATTSVAGALAAADKIKLNSIASGATANSTDTQLRDRSTHTGAQSIATVTNLQTSLDAKEDSLATPSQAEAEAGSSTTARKWTAERVRQAVSAGYTVLTSTFGRSVANATNATVARTLLGVVPEVMWTGSAWPSRPSDSRVRFCSTNDPGAPAPPMSGLQYGDTWIRHPDAEDV